jgi:D-serine deaminase-like pyridoxal phosphate-dependent protein
MATSNLDQSANFLYQSTRSPAEALKECYIGKSLSEIPTPAAIIDVAKVRKNCKLMLEAASTLEVSFRAHVKTHKVSLQSYCHEVIYK